MLAVIDSWPFRPLLRFTMSENRDASLLSASIQEETGVRLYLVEFGGGEHGSESIGPARGSAVVFLGDSLSFSMLY
jgi:hypothetical protein